MRNKKVKSLPTLVIILVIALLSYLMTNEESKQVSTITNSGFEVSFIDVGQGDSAFIITPEGKTLLIDAGEKDFADDVISHLENKNIEKIDVLVATHPHSDHIGGLEEVVKSFDIGEIYMPKASHTSSAYKGLLETIGEKGYRVKTAKNGVCINLGNNINAKFLSPFDGEYENLNNASAVLKITYGDISFLFTGDIEAEAEKAMCEAGLDLKSTVLKMPHHGSSTSSTKQFVQAVSPQTAVISLGKDNEYGHPHSQIVERYEAQGVKIYRTDKSGTITIRTDGKQFAVEEEK